MERAEAFRHALVEIGGGAHCSCCRKCGAPVPCDTSLLTEACDGRCACGIHDDGEESTSPSTEREETEEQP